jgi:hypothetical protein
LCLALSRVVPRSRSVESWQVDHCINLASGACGSTVNPSGFRTIRPHICIRNCPRGNRVNHLPGSPLILAHIARVGERQDQRGRAESVIPLARFVGSLANRKRVVEQKRLHSRRDRVCSNLRFRARPFRDGAHLRPD